MKIKDVEFKYPLTNAAGVMGETKEDLEKVLKATAGGAVTKTMTIIPRKGNPEPRLYLAEEYSINSMGLPNKGYEYYCNIIPELKEKYKKPIIASISAIKEGDIVEQYVTMAKALDSDIIEINTSCPNLKGDPIGLDIELMKEILESVRKSTNKILSVKLMPYNFSLKFMEKVAEIIIDSGVDCISTINSVPFTIDIDLDKIKKVIYPNNGFGGYGGKPILPVALANVHWFYKYFSEHSSRKIYIFGVGGISDGKSAIKHFLVGANIVQVGTALLLHGTKIFDKIYNEILDWLESKGYTKIEDIVGILE
jgi:dihydroorotate dehydrogenase (fumarate)